MYWAIRRQLSKVFLVYNRVLEITNLSLIKEYIMHSKRKGNIGALKVGLEFSKRGYSVFYENGDISKIDLIAENNGKLIRVQVKSVTPINGTINLAFKKDGPNYSFYYDLETFDFFAVYDLVNENVYLIRTKQHLNVKAIKLRISPTKNNQVIRTNDAKNYLFERVLRDYEQDTIKCDDIVQTTTEMASES